MPFVHDRKFRTAAASGATHLDRSMVPMMKQLGTK